MFEEHAFAPAPMPSPIDAIDPAFSRMSRFLFRPFRPEVWLTLGFVAWLAQLGESGGGFGGANSFGQGSPDRSPTRVWNETRDWIAANLAWLIPVVIAGLVVIVLIGAVILWVRCRAKFIFIHNLAHETIAIATPWREYGREGNRLFLALLLLGIGVSVISLAIVGAGLAVAWADLRAARFGPGALVALLGGVPTLILLGIGALVARALIVDFVAPIMYLRRITFVAAWMVFAGTITPGNLGSIAVYLLLKLILQIVAGIAMLAVTCLTCCIAALPYIHAVVFLPVHAFFRLYSLTFLEQFGPEFRVFPTPSHSQAP